ncbi:PspC domain-containing protein [Zobellia galactanivorans]|uniref:PspC domain-containing protein n=1 Tax=Zobellia galactanivorans (strain DSM 12802 / CCUG 47099 / CIP 106680 / NCIMB 13871 / Dsij) TaxID=63186 RepID=UPI001C07D483|nr:PspC domain-containing protein [Zobellia galactanivorans]MBU3027241.1 PspC domain-containing protein [Zobellia galactanivorans]
MNKTININLANMLFHMDEDAYNKMQRYLESVKRSFANTPGSDEILADIEARIAELFHEKLDNERQVITIKQVDEVIAIMGQPEDYMVDEDIFEDEPHTGRTNSDHRKSKKLYRDTEQKYVAGVSSGLAHYFNIDPLWIRLLWVLLTIGSTGGFILIYGLLWLLIPEAATTAQKLDMRGEDVNISNIERKVKEGFDDVAQKIKSVDYEGVGNKVKSGGKSFFDTLGDIIMFFFKVIGKFIGIILIIIGASTIIGLFIGMITVGISDMVQIPGLNMYNLVDASNMPIWLVSILGFLAIGIPFFFLLYLSLKILVNNLKSIGNIAKFSLLGLWLISIIMLIVFGIKQAAARAYSDTSELTEDLYFRDLTDTLDIQVVAYDTRFRNKRRVELDGLTITRNEAGEEVMVLDDVSFYIERSRDSIAKIEIVKESDGSSFKKAEELAEKINYEYKIEGNTLLLEDFLTTARENKIMNQEVRVNIFIPAGALLKYNKESGFNCWRFHAKNDRDLDGCEIKGEIWKMGADGELKCQECPEISDIEEDDGNGRNKIRINKNGIDIDIQDDGESFKMKIDEEGVQIKAHENDANGKNEININEDGINIDVDDNHPEPEAPDPKI